MNWHAENAWRTYLANSGGAREEQLLNEYEGSKVPDQENFAKSRLLLNAYKGKPHGLTLGPLPASSEAVGDFQQGTWMQLQGTAAADAPVPRAQQKAAAAQILAAYGPYEAVVEDLIEAAERPHSRFDSSLDWTGPVPIPDFVLLRTLAQHFRLRTAARLVLDDPAGAMRESQVLHQLGEGLRGHPVLVSCMIRNAVLFLQVQPFYEGWARRQWLPEHYRIWQERFESAELLENFDASMRLGERVGIRRLIEEGGGGGYLDLVRRNGGTEDLPAMFKGMALRMAPSGWWKKNLEYHHRVLDDALARTYDLEKGRIYPKHAQRAGMETPGEISKGWPFQMLAASAMPNFRAALRRLALTQATFDQAALVCALEGYHSSHGSYPPSLEALVPEFCATLPQDLITGEPPVYRSNPDGSFTLYSTGWDGNDEAGETPKGEASFTEGDWNWPYFRLPAE